MGVQQCTAYIAEKNGSLQPMLDAFSAHCRYLEPYYSAISAFSAEDAFEANQWCINAPWAGEETAHLFPFRAHLMRTCKAAGLEDVESFSAAYDQWPAVQGMRATGTCVSEDGLVSEQRGGMMMLFGSTTDVAELLICCRSIVSIATHTLLPFLG